MSTSFRAVFPCPSRFGGSVCRASSSAYGRTSVALALGALVASAPAAYAADGPPSTPEGLSARLYANAGGELFWQRSSDDRGVRGYEVTRNGESLGIFDALSLYDPSLRPDAPYAFTVTAIDSSGQRSGTARVAIGGGGGDGGGASEAPGAPVDLSALVYSSGSGELFWTRSSTPGLRYEVSRDGAVVATTDGTSYYTDALSTGTDYAWSVVAIDADGGRSEPSTVSLTTPGTGASDSGSGTDPAPVTPPPSTDTTPLFPETGSPPAPRNITLAVYSDTTAELNWTRPGFSAGVQLNEILRDGELIDTIPGGGNSYVDDDREPGRGYRYEIVAVKDGRRASSVYIDTGGVQGGPVGTGEPVDASGLPPSLAAALDRTFDLLSLRPFEQVAATVLRLDDPAAVGLTFEGQVPGEFSSSSPRDAYACPGGGRWYVTDREDQGILVDRRIVGEACTIGPITLTLLGNETADRQDDGTIRRFLRISGVDLSDARDGSRIEVQDYSAGFVRGRPETFVNVNDIAVTLANGGYTAESFSLGQGPDRSATTIRVNGENVSGVLAGNARLRSRELLVIGPDGLPTSGAIAIVQLGTNAEAYDINADSGDPDTFTFTATVGGVTTAYDVPWTDVRAIGRPSPDGVDVGFPP